MIVSWVSQVVNTYFKNILIRVGVVPVINFRIFEVDYSLFSIFMYTLLPLFLCARISVASNAILSGFP